METLVVHFTLGFLNCKCQIYDMKQLTAKIITYVVMLLVNFLDNYMQLLVNLSSTVSLNIIKCAEIVTVWLRFTIYMSRFLSYIVTVLSLLILSFPPESQGSPFRHITSTPARNNSAVEGDLVSDVAQVNKVDNQTKPDDNSSLATNTSKTSQFP